MRLDCALMCGVVQKKVGHNLVALYTDQVEDYSKPSPLNVTALMVSGSLKKWAHESNDR